MCDHAHHPRAEGHGSDPISLQVVEQGLELSVLVQGTDHDVAFNRNDAAHIRALGQCPSQLGCVCMVFSQACNVVIEGVPLNQLIEREFALDFGDQRVRFVGARHCAPCAWMDAMIGPGAWALLKGRGGLRARILSDGVLRRGPALLHTEAALDLTTLTQPIAYPRLP